MRRGVVPEGWAWPGEAVRSHEQGRAAGGGWCWCARGRCRAAEGARTMVSAGGGAVVAVVRGVQGGAERARTTASAGRGGGSADPPSPEAAAAAWAGRCLLSPSFLPELRI